MAVMNFQNRKNSLSSGAIIKLSSIDENRVGDDTRFRSHSVFPGNKSRSNKSDDMTEIKH